MVRRTYGSRAALRRGHRAALDRGRADGHGPARVARLRGAGPAARRLALAHGMAMLQLTHLRGYPTDFEATDRQALEAFVAGLEKDTA